MAAPGRLLAGILLPLLVAGCVQSDDQGPDFDVQVYNDSADPVEVRFRATFDATGEILVDETALVPPGYSILAHLDGPRGEYHLEAWAFGQHDEMGPGMGLADTTTCAVYVMNPDPVTIHCMVP